MQANLWHHKLFHFPLPFWIWKVWKRGKNTKIWISREEKQLFSFLIKNVFHSFWRPIIWWKNKNLIKIADTSFKIETRAQVFSVNFVKVLRTPFYVEHLWWLLLTQSNKVQFYDSHVRRSQDTGHAKVLCYFTNKWKTRFD